MTEKRKSLLIQLILVGIFLLAVGYLGRVGWALRPTPPPTPTSTPTSTPTPLPTPTPTPTPTPARFDGARAYEHVKALMAFGPRVPGSEASARARAYMRDVLLRQGWQVVQEAHTYKGVSVVNLVARKGRGPITIIGAHYDSRRFADRDPDPQKRKEPVPGANDGASGTAVLLELARVLKWDESSGAIWLYFFDAEDQGNIDGWPWSVGATFAAQQVPRAVTAVVIVDMVGDKEQQFYLERNSDPKLLAEIWHVAARLGLENVFIPKEKYTIIDDHIPFINVGIPAVDIIDFDYPYWHTTADTADKVSPRSLERIGWVVQTWVEEGIAP